MQISTACSLLVPIIIFNLFQKMNPSNEDTNIKRHDEHLSQLLRYERSLHALMDADIDGQFLTLDNVHYRVEPADAASRVAKSLPKGGERNENALSELHVWIGNSGIVNRKEHPLLHVDDGESAFGEYPASVFEFRVVITIN